MDRILMISADCHAGPPAEIYKAYLDRKLHDAYDHFIAESQEPAGRCGCGNAIADSRSTGPFRR